MATEVKLDTRKLDKIAKDAPSTADGIVRKWAAVIAGDAARDAPVETGALRNSILANSPQKMGPEYYRVQDGVEYGIWQEIGTARMRARPFLTPAVERHWEAFKADFKRLFA